MTNRNSNWKSESGKFKGPIPLLPAGKDYLWGGRRLRDDFSKDIPLTPLAETWECSTHPDGLSLLAGDPGKTLHELLQEQSQRLETPVDQLLPDQWLPVFYDRRKGSGMKSLRDVEPAYNRRSANDAA